MKSILFILACFFTCGGNPVSIIEATSQEYVGGRKESGGGVNYQIKAVVGKSSDKIEFTSIRIGKEELEVKVCNEEGEFGGDFEKGDTVSVFATGKFLVEKNVEGSGEMKLNYKYKGKVLSIEFSVMKLQKLYYP